MPDNWLTKREASQKLQMSEKTIDRLWQKGTLVREIRPVVGKGDLPHFRQLEIDAYIKKQTGRREPGTALVRSESAEVSNGATQVQPAQDTAFVQFLKQIGTGQQLPPSELKEKRYLTMDEAVRYTGLSAGFIRGKATPLTGMRPFRYRREDLDKL